MGNDGFEISDTYYHMKLLLHNEVLEVSSVDGNGGLQGMFEYFLEVG